MANEFLHRENFGKRLSPKQVAKRLSKAGIRWSSYTDLGQQLGLSGCRVRQVFGAKNDGSNAGLSEFATKQWIARWMNGDGDRAKTRHGDLIPAKKAIKKLKKAGLQWSTGRELANMVGSGDGHISHCLGKHQAGVRERTLKCWIEYYKKHGHKIARRNSLDDRYGKHYSPWEARRALKDAGVRWNLKSELASRVGVAPHRVRNALGPNGTGMRENTLSHWITRWHLSSPHAKQSKKRKKGKKK